jgi:hypothetical protein
MITNRFYFVKIFKNNYLFRSICIQNMQKMLIWPASKTFWEQSCMHTKKPEFNVDSKLIEI